MKVSIVIPVYNEAESIPALFEELFAACHSLNPFEVICIDDGSTDNTFELLKEEQARHPEIQIIKFSTNFGKSDGLAAAFKVCRGDIVVTMDADLQNPPDEIPKLIAALDDCDAVIGWRSDREDTIFKRFASRFANGFRGWLLDDDAHDTACALKAFRREAIAEITMYKGMHRFLPALLKMQGSTVKEIKVKDRQRRYGETKYGTFKRGIPGFFDLLAVRWMKKRKLSHEIESTIE